MFLKQSDFNNLITQDHLNQVIGNDGNVLAQAMDEAESEIKSYLRGKFDLDVIFLTYPEFDSATSYVGANNPIVWSNGILWTTAADVLAGASAPPNAPWTATDPRDARIKQIYKDITLYHLHSGISPRNIPDLRVVRYKDAISWLKMVKKGDLSTDLPKVAEPDFSPHVYSQTRQNWMY